MSSPRGHMECLHRAEAGLAEFTPEYTTATAYARRLCYLSCPTTIRARVLREYGRAPALSEIKRLKAEYDQSRVEYKRAWEALGGEPEDRFTFRVGRTLNNNPLRSNAHPVWVSPPEPASQIVPLPPPDFEPPSGPIPRLHKEVIAAVAAAFNLTADDIIGRSRKRHVVQARQTAAHILFHRSPGNSFPMVGRWLGGRDHSTIIHAIEQFHWNATPEMRAVAAHFLKEDSE